jgi:c(7)-type cytochrome triheme protein
MFKDTKSFAPVPFNHDTHKKAGTGCSDCHDVLFKKKAGSTDEGNALTMKALRKGKYCGSCHDGKQAFSASKNCKQCHQK